MAESFREDRANNVDDPSRDDNVKPRRRKRFSWGKNIPDRTTHDEYGRPLWPPSAMLFDDIPTDAEGHIVPPDYRKRKRYA
jgi:hypothetical protein